MAKRLVGFDLTIPCQMEIEIPDDVVNTSSDQGRHWAQGAIEYMSAFEILNMHVNIDDPYNETVIDNVKFADAHEYESEPDEHEGEDDEANSI